MILTLTASIHFSRWTTVTGVVGDSGLAQDSGKGLSILLSNPTFLSRVAPGTFVRSMYEAYARNPSNSDLRALIGRFATVQVCLTVVLSALFSSGLTHKCYSTTR
jgi:hypothetical protein